MLLCHEATHYQPGAAPLIQVTRSDAEGRFRFEVQGEPLAIRLVASAPDPKQLQLAAAFAQAHSDWMAVLPMRVPMVLSRSLCPLEVFVPRPQGCRDAHAELVLEPLTEIIMGTHCGMEEFRRHPPRTLGSRYAGLPKRAPWVQKVPFGKRTTLELPRGRWRIWAQTSDCIQSKAQVHDLDPQNPNPRASLTLGTPAFIYGNVHESLLRPGLIVALHDEYGEGVEQWAPVNAQGHFEFAGMLASPRKLRLTAMPPDCSHAGQQNIYRMLLQAGTKKHLPALAPGQAFQLNFGGIAVGETMFHSQLYPAPKGAGPYCLVLEPIGNWVDGTASPHPVRSAFVQPDGTFSAPLFHQTQYRLHLLLAPNELFRPTWCPTGLPSGVASPSPLAACKFC